MLQSKKAIIVCYTFPPMPGVGGRRWVKFAKYLRKSGWQVRVISGTPAKGALSPWDRDLEGLQVLRLPNRYPRILTKTPRSLFEKISYRLNLLKVKFLSKGNYYDRGAFWETQISLALDQMIQEFRPDCLFVTGAPFSLLYYGAIVKKKYPVLRYVADIRDPWLKGNYFGFKGLSEARKNEEIRRFQFVMDTADLVTAPFSDSFGDSVIAQHTEWRSKILIVPHAVDPDDLSGLHRDEHLEVKRLVNFGSLYSGMETMMNGIAQAMAGAADAIALEFYSHEKKYTDIFKSAGVSKQVSYHPPVDQRKVFEILSGDAAALIFILDHFKDNITTKIMENVAAGAPIVAIGAKGQVSEFITQNRLGIFIEEKQIVTQFGLVQKMLSDLDYNKEFDYSGYTFEYQTRELENAILSLPSKT